jgi:hypothetical protein
VVCGALTLGLCLLAGVSGLAADDDDKKAAAEARQAVVDLANGKGNPKAIADKYEIEDVMRVFKPRDKRGLGVGPKPGAITPDGIEAKWINMGKGKGPSKVELTRDLAALVQAAQVTRAVGEINEHYASKSGQKDPKKYKQLNEDMIKCSKELIDAFKTADPKIVKTAVNKLNQSCNECHTMFRDN